MWQFLRKIKDTAVAKVETERWRRLRSDQFGEQFKSTESRGRDDVCLLYHSSATSGSKKANRKNNEKIEIVIEVPNAIDFTASNSKASTNFGARAKN